MRYSYLFFRFDQYIEVLKVTAAFHSKNSPGMLGNEQRLDICKTSSLPFVLLLWP